MGLKLGSHAYTEMVSPDLCTKAKSIAVEKASLHEFHG